MYVQFDGWMNRWMDDDGCMKRWMTESTHLEIAIILQMNVQLVAEQIMMAGLVLDKLFYKIIDKSMMDGWMNERDIDDDGWKYEWMGDVQIDG